MDAFFNAIMINPGSDISVFRPVFSANGFGLRRWVFMAAACLLFAFVAGGPARAAESAAAEKPADADAQVDLPSGLADLIPDAAALSGGLAQMTRQLAAMPSMERIEPKLKALSARVDALSDNLDDLKKPERRNYERLVQFRRALDAVNQELVILNDPLTAALRKIDRWRSDWRADLKRWRDWKARFGDDPAQPLVQETFDSALQTIAGARERILRHMEPLLVSQKRAFDIQARINELLLEVESMFAAARGQFLHDFSPPMYAPAFFTQFGGWLATDLISGVTGVAVPGRDFFVRAGWVIALQVIVSLALAFGIRRSAAVLDNIDALRFMRQRPHAVGWLIAAAASWNFYEPMPAVWELVLAAIILFTTARLVGKIVEDRRWVALVYTLVAILLVTRMLVTFGLPAPLFRLYLAAIALALGIVCLRSLRRPSAERRQPVYTAILLGIAIACAVVVVVEVSGYSALALHIFRSALRTVFIIVLAWLMMRLARGLLESALRSRAAQKIPFLRTHAAQIIDRSATVLNLAILVLFGGAVLQAWRLYATSLEPIYRLFTFGVTLGGTRVTVGLVLAAAACLYGAFMISRLLQFFLMRDVFSRRRVDPGIGMSITRLLHYAVILVGMLLALATLGFELTNLTIIVSALSVGIGFGLQTIVNNFVCGLILLFERPVKVGDIIQLGDQWATIRDIGLRATTIQTFDRSDIVVPNSDLITNQVTNWTLADRNMRLILPVGVAYGSDVPLVLQTLQESTSENPRILKDPAPLIFFMGFGDSSLDFQVRVWIDDIDYMNVVRSELNQAIDRKFRERGIEIPFPQRDLHLRSVKPAAARAFSKPVAAGAEEDGPETPP